ncbi:MAG: type II toxin-antitoxin system RelE/ParE family toxin [Xanthobacteraceae bacterium]
MRIRYSRRAFAEREAIFDYLEKRNPRGARNVMRAINSAIRSLVLHPRLGQVTNRVGIYELIVPRRPYKVYYRIEREEVWIVHVRDARRRPWQGDGD